MEERRGNPPRLTEALGITVPILSTPMGLVAGGKLAAAVTAAGGLRIAGDGYGDADCLIGNLLEYTRRCAAIVVRARFSDAQQTVTVCRLG
jgi:NAD(P)H-dependent flavin oxidoreductase YrpB (nitropropane dioxygenase family)